MTGRELAAALLALPNPDLPVEIGTNCENTGFATGVTEEKAEAYYEEDFRDATPEEMAEHKKRFPNESEGLRFPKDGVKWDRRAIHIEA
jgi:hypothetical protein